MPLVRISLNQASSDDFARRVGACVHRAMVDTIDIPDGDRFQILAEHDDIVYDPTFLDIERTPGIIIVQITLAAGRSRDTKAALYARIAELLSSELAVRPEDVFISLVEVAPENFSFGKGEARLPRHLQAAGS
jgi:phenylpyruvate tautomerase PptA (4-oxalocrotonate tautomerase family)